MYNHPLSEYFDFAQTCERTDGSRYGTAGQCRKGREVSPSEIQSLINQRNTEIEFQLGGTNFSKKLKKELEIAKRSGELSNSLSATESQISLAQAKLKGEVN